MKARCLSVIATALMVWSLSSGSAISAEIENLVLNGDFELAGDLSHWSWDAQDAIGSLTIDNKEEAATGEASLFAEILDLGAALPHRPNPGYNDRLSLEKGSTYTFSACLKAEEERDVAMKVRLFELWTVCSQKTVSVGTEWQEHYLTFTAQQDADALAGLCFNNTGSDVSYWIDNVWFYEGEYVPASPFVDQAVMSAGKISNTWAAIKALH